MSDQTPAPSERDEMRIASVALQAFFNLSARWELSATQERTLLGNPPESTFYQWKSKKAARRLSQDTLERISHLLGIYKALNILLPVEKSANGWIHRDNTAPLFQGKSALSLMLTGNIVDLADVRHYLDAQTGW